jgi:hypothetical protein
VVLGVPPEAVGTNFSGATGNTQCAGNNMADNRDHYVQYVNLTSQAQSVLNWTRVNNYNPTDVDTHGETNPNPATDVRVEDDDYTGTTCGVTWLASPDGTGMAGLTPCQSLTGSRCQQATIYLDNDFVGPQTTTMERSLACHEFGHTLGLMHRSPGCLVSPLSGSTAISTHDTEHLDWHY